MLRLAGIRSVIAQITDFPPEISAQYRTRLNEKLTNILGLNKYKHLWPNKANRAR